MDIRSRYRGPATVIGTAASLVALIALATLVVPGTLAALAASPGHAMAGDTSEVVTIVAADEEHEEVAGTAHRLSAAFYTDASCLLMIDDLSRVGSTLIDATLGGGVSRTLIHCDTVDGQRLTLLARGVTLGRRERARLLERDSIERGANGIIAWLTREGTSFPDESAPRRYLSRGEVYIREAPINQTAGTAPHADHRAFAQLEGELETLLADPDDLSGRRD